MPVRAKSFSGITRYPWSGVYSQLFKTTKMAESLTIFAKKILILDVLQCSEYPFAYLQTPKQLIPS